jgi:alpha-tubulin suppressor-like RCC1 family protein
VDGFTWSWGKNDFGQLGIGNNANQTKPVQTQLGKVQRLAAGANHSSCVTESGEVFAWGSNDEGQLGLGLSQNVTKNLPQKVTLPELIRDIVTGLNHTLCLSRNLFSIVYKLGSGNIFSWGCNEFGELGLSHNQNKLVPQQALIQNVKHLFAGRHHVIASTRNVILHLSFL